MQPNDFDEEVASSAERGERKRKRQANKGHFKLAETPECPDSGPVDRYFVAETQPRSPVSCRVKLR